MTPKIKIHIHVTQDLDLHILHCWGLVQQHIWMIWINLAREHHKDWRACTRLHMRREEAGQVSKFARMKVDGMLDTFQTLNDYLFFFNPHGLQFTIKWLLVSMD